MIQRRTRTLSLRTTMRKKVEQRMTRKMRTTKIRMRRKKRDPRKRRVGK
jgi:hypothetical protein